MANAPLAVLDVGSNTIRLLVGAVHDDAVETILDASEFVRLGRGVDATGQLHPDRMDAGIAAIRSLAARAQEKGATDVRGIATSAVRDATNGVQYLQRVQEETGVQVEVISGDKEARLTYRGATAGIDVGGGVLVVDLGGGSAEIVRGDARGVDWAISSPLGSGRLTERFIGNDPPKRGELERLRGYVESVLQELPPTQIGCLICTGGTATHLGWLAGARGDIQRLNMQALERCVIVASTMPCAQIVETYGFRPERAQVLPAGVTALETIARFYRVDGITVTQHGIREGALLESRGRTAP